MKARHLVDGFGLENPDAVPGSAVREHQREAQIVRCGRNDSAAP